MDDCLTVHDHGRLLAAQHGQVVCPTGVDGMETSVAPAPLADARAETQLAGYFARYEPAIARLGKALRAKLRARLPGLSEIVYSYEAQNALVISYSPTTNGYEGLFSLGL